MEAPTVARRIADIAACQWGMVTTAQARLHGVARANLAHRVRTGELERTDHYGVYRLAAAPSSPLDDLRAAWRSTNPAALASERTASLRPDAVIASAAAAMVHGIGDVYPAPYRIIVPGRRQSAKGAINYSWRALDSRDVEVVDGLPITTRERTIVDLLVDEGDVSIAADALSDALRGQYDLDETRLAELLAPNAERLGRVQGDGLGALAHLMVVAEVDAVSEASRALDRLVGSKTPLPGMEAFLIRSMEHLAGLAARTSVPPAILASAQTNLNPLKDSDSAALQRITEPPSEGVNKTVLGD